MGGSSGCGLQDALDDGGRRAHDLKPLRIERHSHQVPPLCINQMARGCVARLRRPFDQVPSFARLDRLDSELRVGPTKATCSGIKEDCLASGQELRPAVADLPFLETSQRLRYSARPRYLLEN